MKMHLITLLGFSCIALTGNALAEEDAQFAVGQAKAKVCMTCHGEDGISTLDPYPNLRGQKMGYLISSLKDYKARERSSGLAILMQQQADALSDQDIEDVSYFFSKLGQKPQQ